MSLLVFLSFTFSIYISAFNIFSLFVIAKAIQFTVNQKFQKKNRKKKRESIIYCIEKYQYYINIQIKEFNEKKKILILNEAS